MCLESDTLELELIAKALQSISKEISYGGLAKAVLQAALDYSGAARGAVLLSEGAALLAKADASFPRERAKVFASHPPVDELRLPVELSDRVLTRQETIVRYDGFKASALIGPTACGPEQDIALLCLPLIHHAQTIGVLYLEFAREHAPFTSRCVSVMSMLASQAAVSFESVQLFDALRETNMWMVKGQKIGRMGSYRWNTRTLLSRGSRECYRIFDISLDINPVPFEAFRDRVHPDEIESAEACLRWLARNPSELDEARKSLLRIIEQGHRTSNIVSGLRPLVRDGQLQFADVQINEAVEEVLLFLKRELERAGITVTTAFDTSLPNIKADKVQLQQVVLNLVRNAIDAMADVAGKARMLTVSSKLIDGEASIAFSDTGVGIDPAVGEHLFDALYTTKEGGLGLGLSICRKIIGAHGGRLGVEQNTKHGATFQFSVPIAEHSLE